MYVCFYSPVYITAISERYEKFEMVLKNWREINFINVHDYSPKE